jgi:hypothetical protein
MVCLKANAGEIEGFLSMGLRKSEFIDEDLGNMKTAIAIGPLSREEGWKLFSNLSLA